MMFEGDVLVSEHQQPQHRALAEAMTALRFGRHQEAIDRWPRTADRPPEGLQRLWLAHCHAKTGSAECLELVAPAEDRFPAEAAMIRAEFYAKREDWSKTADELEKFFAALERQPLTIDHLTSRALELAVNAGTTKKSTARRLYDRLSQPLPAYRYELRRPLARYLLAEPLGPAEVIASLEAMEPNVPWAADVLENRAKFYAESGHPLAGRAARDWRWTSTRGRWTSIDWTPGSSRDVRW